MKLQSRIERLEALAQRVYLANLTDDELWDHIATLPLKSSEWYGAVIGLVLRHPSTLPIVRDDPEYFSACPLPNRG